MPAAAHELLTVPYRAAWRAWLDRHEEASDGVWLVLAKKGTTDPTSLTYAEALDEALCSGWIDGQTASIDERIFRRRFTPRRKASLWSERNIGLSASLTAEGRMRPTGIREVERAQVDGRWQRAYAGQASASEPEDLLAALAASPVAAATFATLSKVNRYAVIHRVTTAPNATVRGNRLAKLVAMLERGEAPHPQ
jgi:uncharacterized protein YdeI (YjbR/CyaY-like superfamily)